MKKIDTAKVASALGAKVVTLSELTREESSPYDLLGSPVLIPEGQHYLKDKHAIYHFGSQMLAQHGKSLEDVVGYRILGADEEGEFRRENEDRPGTVICYYGKKS